MTTYEVHGPGVDRARELLAARQYVLDSAWEDAQPTPEEENEQVERHGHDGFGSWHLAVDPTAGEDTKARYGFPYGDFRRVHHSALVACKQRASQFGHDAVEAVADELLERFDEVAADD